MGQSLKRVVWPCFLCHKRHLGRIKQTLAKQLLEEIELAAESYFVQIESDDHCKLGTNDSAHIKRISQHTPSPPNPFTRLGVAVNTWQTPKSQRCRKLLCQGEHVIHLFSHTCLSFGSFVSLTLRLFALCHFQCQHKLLFFISLKQSETLWFGLGRTREGFGSFRVMVRHNSCCEIC